MARENKSKSDDIRNYPLIPLRDIVVFPHTLVPLLVGRRESLEAVQQAVDTDNKLFLLSQKDADVDQPEFKDLYRIGTIVNVIQTLKLPDGSVKILVEAEFRGEAIDSKLVQPPGYIAVRVKRIDDELSEDGEIEAKRRIVVDKFEEYANLNMAIPEKVVSLLNEIVEPKRFVDTVSTHLMIRTAIKQKLLEVLNCSERMDMLIDILSEELSVLEVKRRIDERVRGRAHKTQKDFFLREQMKAIEDELGLPAGSEQGELAELQDKILEAGMPEDVEKIALKELDKLRSMMPGTPQWTVSQSYVETLTTVPWNARTEDQLDIAKAEEILDADHYGLEEPKKRILEYLAVCQLTKKPKGPILCFTGPPGVGKTSLARSVARALNRKFVKKSMGGVHDEAEIRGHRRTYIGALPGRVMQSIIKAESRNPVFLLDEIDKMGKDFRGDPASALLEVLDPAENFAFSDHFLEVDYDLSEVMFITTSNIESDIPYVLRDRLEIIRLSGYTEHEKIAIAKRHLIPRAIESNGLKASWINFEVTALKKIIHEYTREAGVRNLERQISNVCRKVAREIVSTKKKKKVSKKKITAKLVTKYLGVPMYTQNSLEEKKSVGVATGLAWTSTGGEIMAIEVAVMPGNGKLSLTGKLGEVMKESARTALSHIRECSNKFGIDPEFIKNKDIHLHVPEGAVPKDGPSAGVAITLAMVSALSGKKIDREIAMTGEITLRGRVLPIGGVKEKILAAGREGIKKVILPLENRKNFEDIPKDVVGNLEITYVTKVSQAIKEVMIGEKNCDKRKSKIRSRK